MPEWVVKLAISGPIAVKSVLTIAVEKGFNNPFLTTVKIRPAKHGVRVELVARAQNQLEANDAAVFFVGQMIDVLSFKLDLPLTVSLQGEQFQSGLSSNVHRIVTKPEFIDTFGVSRNYGLHRGVLIRALGWYRKGISSEDPIDKFIAFWCSLEGFGSVSARRNERTARGSINQICDCFNQVWGDVEDWKVIPNSANMLNELGELRNGISHGFMPVTIETIRDINEKLPVIQRLSYEFLKDWQEIGPAEMG
jgi:hypothetical protein